MVKYVWGGPAFLNDGKHLCFMNLPAVTVGPTFQINLISIYGH